MKKILLAMAVAGVGFAPNVHAQLAMENFNTGTLPANWALITDGHTVSTSFANGNGPIIAGLNAAGYFPVQALVNGDYNMITTSLFTPAATADRWLITPQFTVSAPNTVLQWDDYDLESAEQIKIFVSPTAGTNQASFTTKIYDAPAGNDGSGSLVTHHLIIGNNTGNIRVGFCDSTNNNWGFLVDNVQVTVVPFLDLSVTQSNVLPFYQTNSSNTLQGLVYNAGVDTITSMHFNYSVNGGAAQSTALTGLNILPFTNYIATSTNAWMPTTAGNYTIKMWCDALNGAGVDANHPNDTLTISTLVVDQLQPKTVMIEEFTQASCDPCANAAPNVDSVYANNTSRSILLRYHVNFPGVDYMDDVTLTPFVQFMLSHYAVSGVPDAQVDGQYTYPGAGYFTSGVIGDAAAIKSPLSIDVTANYAVATHTYSFSADIKAFGPLPSGLVARAALAVDQITYAANQSTESIPQYVFPEVAENMFPTAAGTTLTAFTSGQTQTITSTWAKNHPWGNMPATHKYDSSSTGKIIVWVEDINTKYVYQANYISVPTTFASGVNTIAGNEGSVNIYPNPATNTANVSIKLNVDATVKMEVYNTAGQVVYVMPAAKQAAGLVNTSFDVSNFANGNYFVKMYIGDELLTKKLTIAK